jgi:hypothetical protein
MKNKQMNKTGVKYQSLLQTWSFLKTPQGRQWLINNFPFAYVQRRSYFTELKGGGIGCMMDYIQHSVHCGKIDIKLIDEAFCTIFNDVDSITEFALFTDKIIAQRAQSN